MRAITLWQPHATLIFLPKALGPKRIETRTHDRFKGLVGERIAIHAAARRPTTSEIAWVAMDLDLFRMSLRGLAWLAPRHEKLPLGVVLGTVHVCESRVVTRADQGAALCMITDNRFGLVLDEVFKCPDPPAGGGPVPAKGKRGIWHWEPPAKVVKAEARFLAGLKGGA